MRPIDTPRAPGSPDGGRASVPPSPSAAAVGRYRGVALRVRSLLRLFSARSLVACDRSLPYFTIMSF